MTPSTREIVYGLYGAWRLAHLDKSGLAYFDDSDEGFWKSFFAAALIAPAYAIEVFSGPLGLGATDSPLRLFLVHLLAYSLTWTVFPVVLYPICKEIGREAAYVRFVVAYNWARVVQLLVKVPALAIVGLGVLPDGAALLLQFTVHMLVLAYQWFVARTALDVGGWPAAGVVALDLVILLVLGMLMFGMVQ